ncbi:MAG TPA: YceI family protein [Hanamia sp.]|nr:YceI family protein [Hanamia sp.]
MLKKVTILLLFFSTVFVESQGQIFYTKNGNISFFSKTIMENISAENNQVISVINIQSGIIQFSLLNNAFHFPKAKMENDFNEAYIESDKYPRSSFKGIMTDIGNMNFNNDGTYKVNVKGDLMIHGVTKNINVPAIITIKNGNISAASSFVISVKDYKIKIPSIVTNKIAETIEVKVRCDYEKK